MARRRRRIDPLAAVSLFLEGMGLIVFAFWLIVVTRLAPGFIRVLVTVMAVGAAVIALLAFVAYRRLLHPRQSMSPLVFGEQKRLGPLVRVVPRGSVSYAVVDERTGDLVHEFETEAEARDFCRGIEEGALRP